MIGAYLHSVDEVMIELHERGFYPACSDLSADHRCLAGPKDVFLAVSGEKFDSRTLADDLLKDQRCGLVLVDYDDRRAYERANVLPVLNLKAMLAELANRYYESSSDFLKIVAVTGTNGKTTVTRWVAEALTQLGQKAAVIGTLGYGAPNKLKAHTGLTTPDVVSMHRLLHDLRRQGFEAVCLEASSIGLDRGRLSGVSIDMAVFTNLSQDHLDYHGNMFAYGQSKMKLASWPTLSSAVVNVDCAFGLEFSSKVKSRSVPCMSVGHSPFAACQIVEVIQLEQGQHISLQCCDHLVEFDAQVVGEFNAENLVLVFAVLIQLGYEPERVLTALEKISPAPGRMQQISDRPLVVVDYAHTPDALEKTLGALKSLSRMRSGKLWVVFGCGGDRDRTKRPLMGSVAVLGADSVVITSDNPRSEPPQAIIDDIRSGIDLKLLDKVHVEQDRVKAIEWVLMQANECDVILLAGKGHEESQAIGMELFPHSDALCAQAFLLKRGAHA
jgi:UDP-N-acetylmuramyl-tripeptide synthetase